MSLPLVVALLGAESTGKTTLSHALGAALAAEGHDVVVVPEYLREFCVLRQRTPQQHEQLGIAREQTRRIAAAAAGHAVVIADTSALMIAVYSDLVFGDTSLYPECEAAHRACGLSLLTALDLPWQADGLQRDGPQVREPVDALVRASLARTGRPWSVVFGTGPSRLDAALAGVRRALALPPAVEATARWHGWCDRCGDAACERHTLLPRAAGGSEG